MRNLSRRKMLFGAAALTVPVIARAQSTVAAVSDRINMVDPVAPDIYFHQGDISGQGHCNNGWILFKDYVLVVDANYPSGANVILPKIRALTQKPIRFVFDTHHHRDHAYGNQVWVDQGATPIAHTGVMEEMRRYETGYYGGKPGRWEETAQTRPDVAASRLHMPSVLFPSAAHFDDEEHRVELLHLGVGHTHGDAVAWLPKEGIVFTGDLCVNGPHNYLAHGNIQAWITTLDAIRKLGPKVVCPGHGPRGGPSLLEDQQIYFRQLRERVSARLKLNKSAADILAAVPKIREEILAQPRIARFIGKDNTTAHVDKVYEEMTGHKLPISPA